MMESRVSTKEWSARSGLFASFRLHCLLENLDSPGHIGDVYSPLCINGDASGIVQAAIASALRTPFIEPFPVSVEN